jgi:hypothetical protein
MAEPLMFRDIPMPLNSMTGASILILFSRRLSSPIIAALSQL